MKERPQVLKGSTHKVRTGCGNLFVTVNHTDEGKPFEVFVSMGKQGGCNGAYTECIARLISMALRNGTEIQDIIKHTANIRCPTPIISNKVEILSCPDAIAHALKEYLPKEEKKQ